ncbi:serine/threonine protein phosphatase 1 [Bradyrhizobium erythrophlei]|jgi:serine/threonine protein phosphatase 1|nr:serine/threonine protein phosphatase 1 [Bradyrhizobium erythrophlei]
MTGIDEAAGHEVTFAIGDIHGCRKKLLALLRCCGAIAQARKVKYVFLGDYVDRGPEACGVVDLLIERQRRNPGGIICLRGNHEQMLLAASHPDRSDQDLMMWMENGGRQTLASYGCDDPCDIPAAHLAWFRSLPLTHAEAGRMYVHAGVRPDIPLNAQTEEDLLWIREPFLSSDQTHEAFIVHGHTPVRLPDLRANRLNLDTGACFGGPLTAAMFEDQQWPAMFINDLRVASWPDPPGV